MGSAFGTIVSAPWFELELSGLIIKTFFCVQGQLKTFN